MNRPKPARRTPNEQEPRNQKSTQVVPNGSRTDRGPDLRERRPRRSVFGRPRALTEAKIARILEWHDSRVTLRELAASLGVSTSTVVRIIETRGTHYKQAPPEEREESLNAHRAHCSALREANLM